MDVKITGADQLSDLGKALKGVDKSIKNEFTKELRASGKPAGDAVRNAYGDAMPQRGGLAARLRASKIGIRTRTTGKNAGVRLDVRNQHDLPSIEKGILRHPVWGGKKWVAQSVPAGVGDAAFQKQQPTVQRRMLAAMDAVGKKIMGAI